MQKSMISIDALLVGFAIPFDVYVKHANDYSLVLKKWTKFDQRLKDELKSKGILHLYIEGDPIKIKEHTQLLSKSVQTQSKTVDNFKVYAADKSNYHQVSRVIFPVGTEINFSLYSSDNFRFSPLLVVSPGKTAKVPESIKTTPGDIMIKSSDIALYREYLANLTRSSSKSEPEAKVAIIKEGAKLNIRDFLNSPLDAKSTEGVISSANQILYTLKRKEAAVTDMLSTRAKDFQTYNHINNVTVLATAIGIAMGLDADKIERLALGAVMHDVGKSTLPSEVLHKRERLTDAEFSVWKKHVIDGLKLLQGKTLPREAVLAVQHHHEKLSGKGYPFGLKGSAVLPFGQILAIVDSYDSLMTPKPIRPPLKPFNVLEIILKDATSGDYDPEIVKLLINVLKAQGKI